MKRTFGIFIPKFGRGLLRRKVYFQPDPLMLQEAVERYVPWLIGTLTSDRPEALTIDCTGINACLKSLVAGVWQEMLPITPTGMEGIIEGRSVDIEPATAFWDYFQRLYSQIRQAKSPTARHALLAGPMQSMTLRLEALESGRGSVHCRFSFDS